MKLTLASALLAACASPTSAPKPGPRTETPRIHEDAIVTKVRAAIAGRVAFDALEANVGQPAVARTPNVPLAIIRRAIVEDPAHPTDALAIDANTADVIYWDRPTTDRNPHVVGVHMKRDGSRTIFFGVIPPP